MSSFTSVRIMKPTDVEAIIEIDRKITGIDRPEYYRHKLAVTALNEARVNTSLVAEVGGKVSGFLMGTLYFGEFGIPETSAVIDTLGVDPGCTDRGVGAALFEQFRSNMRGAKVERIYTLVDWKDHRLLKFFGKMGFVPSRRLSLECRVE